MTIETTYDNLAFVPGDSISGRATWTSEDSGKSREMVLKLIYFTEGTGRRDREVAAETTFISDAGAGEFDFSFPKDSPHSHKGKLFSLKWALELRPSKGRSERERLEIVYSPSGSAIDLYAYASEDMPVVKTGVRVTPT